MREQVQAELEFIVPIDDIERAHLDDALAWVKSGAQLCRLEKPATPPKHLVSYFVAVDDQCVLLVDHKNAQLWLPAGGHVEPGEHPRTAVERELLEELGFPVPHPVAPPVMVTCAKTVGLTAGHVDVSLWYVVRASPQQPINFDRNEFNAVRRFPFPEVPLERADPHMGRFLAKMSPNPLPSKLTCAAGGSHLSSQL